MKKLLLWLTLVLATASELNRAAEIGAKAEVRSAIQALAEQPSYAWTSTSKAEGSATRQGPTLGQTEKNGYTYFKLTVGDNALEAAFKGMKSALKAENDWESSTELRGDREWLGRRLQSFKAPVAEAEDLLTKAALIRKEPGGLYSADLTGQGAQDLIQVRSRTPARTDGPRNTKGWVKFWVKNGALTRYEYNVQGKVIGQDLQEHDVNRTISVEIAGVGSTQVQVPEEAKKKLF